MYPCRGSSTCCQGRIGIGAPDQHRSLCLKSSDQVGNKPVLGPVASTNHVSGPRSSHRDIVLLHPGDRKKGAAVSRAYDLRAGLAGGIGIVTAEGIRFAIGPDPLPVFVALVGRNAYHRAHRRSSTHSLQHMRGAHDVRRICAQRIGVRAPYQRLRRQMKNYVRSEFGHRCRRAWRCPECHRERHREPRQWKRL